MLIILKLSIILLLLVQILTIKFGFIYPAAIASELVILFYLSSVGIAEILKKNIMAVSAGLFFGMFAFISQLITSSVNEKQIALIIIRIFFVFNSIIVTRLWIGRSGLISIISCIPFQRLRMFFILFMKITDLLFKSHTEILNQLKTRLDLNWSGKMIFARYYVQNLIQTEFYAYHNYQAALYTRLLNSNHELYSQMERVSFRVFALLLIVIAATLILFLI